MPLIRIALLGLALAGGLWSLLAGAGEWGAKPLRTTAARIQAGQTFEMAALRPTLDYIERTDASRTCLSGEPAEAAVIQYAFIEQLLQQPTPPDDPKVFGRAYRDVARALSCRPAQPFLWYALFRLEELAGTPPAEILPFLEMSYRLGPREGWIMSRRSLHSVEVFNSLTPDLQARVRAEFTLLARDQHDLASVILALTEEENVRQALLSAVAELPLERRQALASRLNALDVLIDIPGVDYDARQPWRKRP